LYITANFLK